MSLFWEYVRALTHKWAELVTSGLVAVYVTVQPYYADRLPPISRSWFIAIVIAAGFTATFRVWVDERRKRESAESHIQAGAAAEEPHVLVYARWPENDLAKKPVSLMARNRGKTVLRNVRFSNLRIGLYTVTFNEVPELQPDVDTDMRYIGPPDTTGDQVDIHDLLMMNSAGRIDPREYPLALNVQKVNGQARTLRYVISYAPLHDRRRNPVAEQPELCIHVESVS